MNAPRVVFVPASGPRGSGEAYRCLNLARALHDRRPDLDLHVLLDRRAGPGDESGWTVHPLEDTPARAADAVAERLEALAPALAVFDGSGRTAHLRQVRRQGGRVAWLSNRPSRRRRGFSPRRLRWIDLHVLVGPGPAAGPPGLLERLVWRLAGRPELLRTSAIAPPMRDGDRSDPGADPAPAVFVAGGGGQSAAGRPVPDLFVDAARRFHAATGHPARVVLGPQYAGEEPERDGEDVQITRSLSTEALGALLAGAGLVVAGAGNMLSNQVLLAGRPCVMTATGGHDQPERLARLGRSGAVRPVALDPGALADAAIALFEDRRAQRQLIAGIRALGVVNDTHRVAERLLALIDR